MQVKKMALDFRDEEPRLEINGMAIGASSFDGTRYGFTRETALDEKLLTIIFVLAHKRIAGVNNGWTRAEEIANFAPGGLRAASTVREYLGRTLEEYAPHAREPETTHLVQYRPRIDAADREARTYGKKRGGRYFGHSEGPYRIGPSKVVIHRRGFLAFLAPELAKITDLDRPDFLLGSAEANFWEAKLGTAYATYWHALSIPQMERKPAVQRRFFLDQVKGFVGLGEASIELGQTALGLWCVERAKKWLRHAEGKGTLSKLQLIRLESLLHGQGGNAEAAVAVAERYTEYAKPRDYKELRRRPSLKVPYVGTLGQALTKTKRFAEADGHFAHAINLVADDGDASKDVFWMSIMYERRAENAWRWAIADTASATQLKTDARRYIEEARKYDEHLPPQWGALVHRLRAKTLLRLNEPAEALAEARAALDAATRIGMLHETDVLQETIAQCERAT